MCLRFIKTSQMLKLLSICYKSFSAEEKETLLNLLEKMSLNLEKEETQA